MFFKRLKKRRGGQIRAVDFVVSLLLFLIMLSQLILVIINVQSSIWNKEVDILTYSELDLLGRSFLQECGSPSYWAYQKSLPSAFGLAKDYSQFHFVVDAAKISRIIPEAGSEIERISGYEILDYNTLKEALDLESNLEFTLAIYPYIDVTVDVSAENITANTIKIQATDPDNSPISGATTHVFIVDLLSGHTIPIRPVFTNNIGEVSISYQRPRFNEPEARHFVFVIVEKGSFWGMNWGIQSFDDVTIGPSTNTIVWGGGINTSSLLITDSLEYQGDPESHFISIIYRDSQLSFSNRTIDITDSLSINANETIPIPTEGLVTFFSIDKTADNFRVGVGSYPAILDRDLDSGHFYRKIGHLTLNGNIKTMISKIYPIVVRGTLMRCQLNLWSE
jgi:hypothetical protein